ncbi:MAG: ATP-binding cassette domain-containing protein [Myxococcota bacterium]
MSTDDPALPSAVELYRNYRRMAQLMRSPERPSLLPYAWDAAILAAADLLLLHSITAEDLNLAGRLVQFVIGMLLSRLHLDKLLARGTDAFCARVEQLRERVVDRIRRLDLHSIEQLGPQEIVVRLTSDAELVQSFAISFTLMTRSIAMAIIVTMYALATSVLLSVIVLPTIVVLAILIAARKSAARAAAARIASLKSILYGRVSLLVTAFKQIVGHPPRGDAIARELHQCAAQMGQERIAIRKTLSKSILLQRFVVYGIIGFVGFGLRLLYPASTSVVASTILILTYATYAITTTASSIPEMLNAGVALDRLEQLDAEIGARARAANQGNDQTPSPFASLELRGLSYAHEAEGLDRFVVGPIDLTLRAGELVFMTGDNGSGKSTLIHLLAGLYLPRSGAVYVNGERTETTARSYRDQFCYVPVSAPIFNQLYGAEDADPTKVNALLERLELAGSISFASGRFSTVELSTGQRKRLAMVAALMRDRPVFIFDEWAADQDPRFVRIFYEQILPELRQQGRLVIAVSHDDHYFDRADRIIALREGEIIP